MTDEEMAASAIALIGDSRFDDLVPHYLSVAKGAVVSKLFPYDDKATWEDVPDKHHARTVEIAVYLVNRRGSEGEVNHSESGVSRGYESAGIPKSYFQGMISKVGVPK